MDRIENYKVAYTRDGKYLEDIVETNRLPEDIKNWYLMYKASIVIGVNIYTEVIKSNQNIVRI